MGLLNSNTLHERAMNIWDAIKRAPGDVSRLFQPETNQQLNTAMARPQQANPQQWIDAGMELSGMAPISGLLAHTVYHGSPHKFSKFDMSKIGTGEGAQAYGHGLYFAEAPGVAQSYAKELGGRIPAIEINGNTLVPQKGSVAEQALNIASGATGASASRPFDHVRNKISSYGGKIENSDAILKQIAEWENAGGKVTSSSNLYKVDIPDEAIPRMLDWDKPLSEQAESVRNALKRSDYGKITDLTDTQVKIGGNWFSKKIIPDADKLKIGDIPIGYSGQSFLETVRSDAGFNNAGTSSYLKSLGIPGIRYLDGSSRNVGKGTSNFVLFDDQLPRILEVNGKPTGLLSYADEAKRAKRATK